MTTSDFAKKILRTVNKVLWDTNLSLQKKFDVLVKVLVQELCVDVSSIYLVNSLNKIELTATEGLSKEAVNRMAFDAKEGIIGHIFSTGKPANVVNVWENEFFIYKPETAEDPYYTMIGVPIICKRKILGVLSIQNRPQKPHPNDHQEILEIVASVLAEIISKGGIHTQNMSYPHSVQNRKNFEIRKQIQVNFLNPGYASGKIILHNQTRNCLPNVFCESSQKDLDLFLDVFYNCYSVLSTIDKEIIDFLDNNYGFKQKVLNKIKNGLMPDKAINEMYDAIFVRLKHDKHKLDVLKLLTDSLILGFLNQRNLLEYKEADQGVVIIAKTINSKELLNYLSLGIKGIILERCSSKSHVLALAKSLNVPLVTGFCDICGNCSCSTYVCMDSDKSTVEISDELFDENLNFKNSQDHVSDIKIQDYFPGISLLSDVNLLKDVEYAEKNKCFDGIGLVRTEMLFGHLPIIPDQKIQVDCYKKLFQYFNPSLTRIRLFDFSITSDFMDYYQNLVSDGGSFNPDLGFRGIRVLLENKNILEEQIKSIIEAANGRVTYITFPMVACVDEVVEVKKIIKAVGGEGYIKMGLFIELPSVVFELESFIEHIDFLQIGNNDLLQCFYGVDRNFNAYRANNLRVLTYPFLNFLKKILVIADLNKKLCIVSGATASNYMSIIAMYALGFRTFSMHYSDVEPLLRKLEKVNIEKIQQRFYECMEQKIHDIRSELEKL